MHWIISANSEIYNHQSSFEKYSYIDWKQTANYEVGDIIYIYSTQPIGRVQYKTKVEEINMSFAEIKDDKEFWKDEEKYYQSQDGLYSRLKLLAFVDKEELSLDYLLKYGLNGAPQGPTKLINERAELINYLEKYFGKTEEIYSWIPFYEELADKLYEYKNRKDELFEIIKELREEHDYFNYLNFEKEEWWGPRNYTIDPFSVFAVMNRGITDANRFKIGEIYKETFVLNAAVPNDFTGIPVLNNMQSFFADKETNELWILFEEAINYAETKEISDDLIAAYDAARKIKGNGMGMLTIALYLVRPNVFMPLDRNSREYIASKYKVTVPTSNNDQTTYFKFLNELEKVSENIPFYNISYDAWLYDENEMKIHPSDLTKEDWSNLLKNPEVFTENALITMKAFMHHDGKATCTQLANKFGRVKNFYKGNVESIGQRVSKETGIKVYDEGGKERWWRFAATGEDAPEEVAGSYYWQIRPELADALDEIDLSDYPLYEKDKKFIELNYYFAELNEQLVELSFSEIEEIIGQSLPKSVTIDSTYWSGPKDHALPRTWESNGYQLIHLSLEDQIAIFEKKTRSESRLEIITEVINELGGEATYSAIYNQLKNKPNFYPENFASDSNLQASVRRIIQEHSSDSSIYESSNEDIFYSVKGVGRGVWGVRESYRKYEKRNDIYIAEDFLSEVYMSEGSYNTIRHLLKEKKNLILQGAPGVGKTFAAKRLAYSMMEEEDNSRIEFIQFHQNYSYEDFVMGYQPDGEGFTLKEGLFIEFCEKARVDEEEKDYFLIIDEINRGNISKIFGELLMAIEKDYRGEEVKMAYNGMLFSVPENLYIIGMMNTADRSLALIDYALRRRFSFYEMTPGFQTNGFKKYQASLENEHFNQVIERIEGLNIEIKQDPTLGDGFQIGHSYFTNQRKESYTDGWLKRVIQYEIIPMLQEYWFDDEEKVKENSRKLMSVFDYES